MPPARKRRRFAAARQSSRSRFDHFEVRPPRPLATAVPAGASRAHACRCHVPGGLDRRPCQLSLSLRAAAGAALSCFPGGHIAGAICRQGARAARQARNRISSGPVRARLLDCVCGAWCERQRDRLAHPRLFGSARHRRRDHHHHHGSAFPRRHADRTPAPSEAVGCRQAGRAMGRVCDRACVCVRMDAVHRADPRRHPGGSGVGADGDQGREPARGLFAGPRHSFCYRRLCDRAVRGLSLALSQLSSPRRAGHGRVAGA